MGKRLLTSFFGIILFFAVVLTHRYVLYSAVIVLTLGMLYEMYGVMCVGKFLRITGYFSAVVMCVGFILGRQIFALTFAGILFMLAMIFMHGKVTSKKVMALGFVTVMISALMSMLVMTRQFCPKYTVILTFVCAWLSDTGAFFAGSLFGKHKLAEKISPKKTVEGAIGGAVLAAIGSVAFLYIVAFAENEPVPTVFVVKFAILGLLASVISQFGDLSASCIKRDFEKKDYGKILPGHGGLLDRFDSVLFAAPFVFYAMQHFIVR